MGTRELVIEGAHIMCGLIFKDDRGEFINAYRNTDRSIKRYWENQTVDQINISRTFKAGTIRGIHYQKEPDAEAKIVKCIRGRVWDVIVDVREGSDTYLEWEAIELSQQNNYSLLIPKGCGHGFQALEPNTELLYIHSGHWNQSSESGIMYNDETLNINWPLPPCNISDRDLNLPRIQDQ